MRAALPHYSTREKKDSADIIVHILDSESMNLPNIFFFRISYTVF